MKRSDLAAIIGDSTLTALESQGVKFTLPPDVEPIVTLAESYESLVRFQNLYPGARDWRNIWPQSSPELREAINGAHNSLVRMVNGRILRKLFTGHPYHIYLTQNSAYRHFTGAPPMGPVD